MPLCGKEVPPLRAATEKNAWSPLNRDQYLFTLKEAITTQHHHVTFRQKKPNSCDLPCQWKTKSNGLKWKIQATTYQKANPIQPNGNYF